MKLIDEAGILALSTRLINLSDAFRKEGSEIYKYYGIDFEPKWFPVIYSLYKRKTMSVVEISKEIGYAHPSTISLLKELQKNDLIISEKHISDSRKRMISLSIKGTTLLEKVEPVWQIMIKAISEATNTKNNLMNAIIEVEEQLQIESFTQRVFKLGLK